MLRSSNNTSQKDPVYPELRGVLSAFSSLLSIYLTGLLLLLFYLYILSISRDHIMNSVHDPLYRNIALLIIGGVLTIAWLTTWYLSILLIRRFLSR